MISTYGKFLSFVSLYIGTRIDYDGVYGYQCVDAVKFYADKIMKNRITTYGNAIDLWNKGLGKGWNRIPYTIGAVPYPGDILCFKQSKSNGMFGYIAIAGNYSTPTILYKIEQNSVVGKGLGIDGDQITLRSGSYRNCLGWFRTNK